MKSETNIIWLVGTILLVIPLLFSLPDGTPTGAAAETLITTGCCSAVCQESGKEECFGNFFQGQKCDAVAECNVGCCIDGEGYCLGNYLQGVCEQQGGNFVSSRECFQHWQCLSVPPAPLGYTGYPVVFESLQEGIIFAEPASGKIGQIFTLKVNSLGQPNEVKAKISYGEYEKTIPLYDDGSHGDGNQKDGLYAGIWNSGDLEFDGIRKIGIVSIIDGKESLKNHVLVSSTDCISLSPFWEDGREEVIFFGAVEQAASFNALSLGVYVKSLFNLQNLPNMNFYRLTKPKVQVSAIKSTVREECTYYDDSDKIIYFDESYDYCEENEGVVRVSPKIRENRNIKPENAKLMFEDFCRYLVTEKELEDRINSMGIPPEVKIISPENASVYVNFSEVPFAFEITDNYDASLYYEIYVDINHPETLLKSGTAKAGEQLSTLVSVPDGRHELWIEASDGDGNIGASDIMTINVNVSNFVVDILSLESLTYKDSPEVVFTISHMNDVDIEYELISNGKKLAFGKAPANANVTVPTSLDEGDYVISVRAKDNINKTAVSLPYAIKIGLNG